SIAGCMYRVVQTTGPDGKNLLKLLPISKSSGGIVESSAMPNNSKVNISSPVHLTFKTQLAKTTAPSSVNIPVFQSPNPGKIILARTLDKQEGVRTGSEKESSTPKPAPNIQSVSSDRLSLQNIAVTSSSNQNKTAYMLVNTKTLPVTVKSSVLPSGHHLQIPADAEVKSVPASSLPPAIQQKILATAATNVSGGADSTKMPTVIYVSPVNTVKTVLPKRLQAICPKPATELSKTLIITAAQRRAGSSSETGSSARQQCQQTPMKWIVQDSPQTSAPCLIPVKSSNNVASKILKTLSDTDNEESNSANILPLCSSDPGGSQTKITSVKDNALVMYKGKVYLLTKRGFDVLSAQADKQASSSSDALLTKEASKLINSTTVNKITHKVVNLVLSKRNERVLSREQAKPPANSKNSSPADLRKDLKSSPAPLVTPSAHQQNPAVNQRKSLPCTKTLSDGLTPIAAVGTQESVCQNGRGRIHSPKAVSAALPQSKQECALSEDWQKIKCEAMDSPRKVIPVKRQEKPHWEPYLELRKKFGLFKEERVYLKRIPVKPSWEKPEESLCPSSSLKRKRESCTSVVDVEVTDHRGEGVEKAVVKLEEDLTKKRKIKSSPPSDSGKRRKTTVKSTTNPSSGNTSSSFSLLTRSVSPPPVPLQESISTDAGPSSLVNDSEQDPYSQFSDVTESSIPVLVSCEDNSFGGSFRDDAFPLAPPDLDETIRDEKIKRLKQLLREQEAALEEMRRK
ncbi:LRIF1 factor, partial [Heliornis fulica]|nr:LRIF1 factor [Heliornis fulica]